MPARDRPPPKLISTVYRTYPISEELRDRMSTHRELHGQTTAAFLSEAIDQHLSRIVAELQAVGIPAPAGENVRPARLPLDLRMLDILKQGANATGVPATRLLAACIDRASRVSGEK